MLITAIICNKINFCLEMKIAHMFKYKGIEVTFWRKFYASYVSSVLRYRIPRRISNFKTILIVFVIKSATVKHHHYPGEILL